MNFTLDDNAPPLIYLPGAWGVQLDGDLVLSSFFGGTYHAAQVNGASVNMSLVGTDVYLWGSKGPKHVRFLLMSCSHAFDDVDAILLCVVQGNFSVQYDGNIAFLSAHAPTMQYQQLLFHVAFNASSTHFVSLKAVLDDENNWLDLDFITFTDSTYG